MSLLSLLCVGFWLIVFILHFEIRKREIEEQNLARGRRHEEALTFFQSFCEQLDEDDRQAAEELLVLVDSVDPPENPPESAPENSSVAPTEDPTADPENPSPAEIAAMVAPAPPAGPGEEPRPSLDDFDATPPAILREVQNLSAESPQVAISVLRRFLEQDPKRPALYGSGA